MYNNTVTRRPIAREGVSEHVSVEIDSWKPSRRYAINRRFLGYGNEKFSVGPFRRYIPGNPDRVAHGSPASRRR
jgi:hypothetical protein